MHFKPMTSPLVVGNENTAVVVVVDVLPYTVPVVRFVAVQFHPLGAADVVAPMVIVTEHVPVVPLVNTPPVPPPARPVTLQPVAVKVVPLLV